MEILLIICLAFAILILIMLFFKLKHLKRQCDDLVFENESLEKYKSIPDVELHVKQLLENAEKEGVNIKKDAQAQVDVLIQQQASLQNEIDSQMADAKTKIRRMLAEADAQKNVLLEDVYNMMRKAENLAQDIEKDSYESLSKADKILNAAKAAKNIIEGYGNEFIKPSFCVLDSLAEEYGFDDAAVKLKNVREMVRAYSTSKKAATCDYVEQNRRDTAINFVIDAFNGKVDAILSLVKKDNYGILEKKIKDAYSMVNFLGTPFRSARIVPEYLEMRLEELKWAVAIVELKARDKEEQRLIREQMREEEKARREYEKAIKDAEKEEALIRKAMEKAQSFIEKSTAEERLKYEAQLAELQQKLIAAEEKGRRAISMAQQTRSGYVYVISNIGSFGEDVYKIGMTRRLEPLERVRELGDASVPFPFDVHAMIYSEDAPTLETELHKIFAFSQVNKVNPKKEFFRIGIADIRQAVESRNIQAKWTITAEAKEYRESVAIANNLNLVKQ